MLRNSAESVTLPDTLTILNEVLSLNAQEFVRHIPTHIRSTFLNEVLSLNAQEYGGTRRAHGFRKRPQ